MLTLKKYWSNEELILWSNRDRLNIKISNSATETNLSELIKGTVMQIKKELIVYVFRKYPANFALQLSVILQ